MGSRVEHFVMVDAERANRVRSCPGATNLWGEESRCNAGKNKQPGKAMEVRYAYATGKAGNLGVVPFNGKCERRAAKNPEIISIVRVLPNILTGENQVLPECLLQPRVKFITPAGAERSDHI